MSQKGEYLVQDLRTLDAGGITQYVKKLAENGWELLLSLIRRFTTSGTRRVNRPRLYLHIKDERCADS